MQVSKCSKPTAPTPKPEYLLTWDDICKHEGVYRAQGMRNSQLVVMRRLGSMDVAVLYAAADTLEPASSHWKEHRFHRLDSAEVCFEIRGV